MINNILARHSRPSHRQDQLVSTPSHPQRVMTTGQAIAVRYTVDDELWEGFTVEQVTKQIKRLCETGRFREPNNGGPFVVRVSYYALMGDLDVSNNTDQLLAISPVIVSSRDLDILDKQGHRTIPNTQNSQRFYDFSCEGDTLTITQLTRLRRPGSMNWTTQQRQDDERAVAEVLRDAAVDRIWWDRDYLCVRCQLPQAEWEEYREIARMAANVVVILLQDRMANKIAVKPRTRPKLKLKFLQRRPQIPNDENAPEILLTIPRRVYPKTPGKAGKSHTPPRMHYRAEHVRQQPYGPRSAPSYREIVILGRWINAEDIPPEERGTPITRNYKFKALRAKTK